MQSRMKHWCRLFKPGSTLLGVLLLGVWSLCTKTPQTPEVVPFAITTSVSPTGSGSTSPASAEVNRNGDLSIVASPNKSGYYHFLKWVPDSGLTIDGALDSATWVRNVTRSGTITALFGIDSFSVTMSTNFGTVTPSGTVSIPYNQGFTITASNAPRGYRFKQWTKTGALTIVNPSISSTTISNVTSNGTVAAEFEEITVPSNVLCVDSQSVASTPDGTTWARAYSRLQDALAAAGTGARKEIWVAKGTYTTNSTTSYFDIPAGGSVYGGFLGIEQVQSSRDWINNTTVLSADIPGVGQALRVVRMLNDGYDMVLDGFTILRAYYYGIYVDANNTQISNCIVKSCDRTGIYIADTDSTLIKNCVLTQNNYSTGDGSALSLQANAHKVIVHNTVVFKNSGAAILAANQATDTFELLSCTVAFNHNTNTPTGGIVNQYGNISIVNTIVWGNTGTGPSGTQISGSRLVEYSCVQDGLGLGVLDREVGGWKANNITSDPQFFTDGSLIPADKEWFIKAINNAGLRLAPTSPCRGIGGGYPTVNRNLSADIRGAGRSGSYDIGAYEMP